jgi:hypothetical protein
MKTLKALKNQYPDLLCVKPLDSMVTLRPYYNDMTKKQLHDSMRYKSISRSLKKDGMINPIIIQDKRTLSDIYDQKTQTYNIRIITKFPVSDDITYIIYAGSNRFCWATVNNYTHIECYLSPNYETTHKLVRKLKIYAEDWEKYFKDTE